MMRGTRWLALALALALAGCSDDSGTPPAGDGPVGGDVATVDQGQTPDGPAPAVDLGPPSEGGVADAAGGDGSSAQTFNIELTVGFGLLVMCQASNADNDCEGDVYWSIYDHKPPTDPNNPGNPIYEGLEKGAKKGTVIKAQVPLASQMWIAGFMDDDNNVDPNDVKPDKGDPVASDAQSSTAQPGATVKRTLEFFIRMP